jgi:hypothetical protein
MRGSCGKKGLFGRDLPCPYDGPPVEVRIVLLTHDVMDIRSLAPCSQTIRLENNSYQYAARSLLPDQHAAPQIKSLR